MMTEKRAGEKYGICRSVASGAFFETECTGRGNAKVLVSLLSDGSKSFKAAIANGRSGGLGRASGEWLLDNFYILEEESAICKKELKKCRGVMLSGKYPTVFSAARLYIKRLGKALDKSACDAFTDALCSSGFPVFMADIFSVSLLMKSALLCVVYDCAAAVSAEKEKDAECAKIIGDALSSLKYISYHRFDKSFSCCETEKLLESDPSGDYTHMSDETKAMYRNAVAEKAKREGKSERDAVLSALAMAKNGKAARERHIGLYLFEKPCGGVQYLTLLFALTAAFTALLFFSTRTFLCLLLVFPIWEAVKQSVDFIFSKLYKSSPLPRLDPKALPSDTGVLAVITSLLLGEKNDRALYERLERLWLTNGTKLENSYFGILGDFPDSQTASASSDAKTLEYAERRIAALCEKYGNHFCLFVRNRRYSKSEKSFMGWERKRGAVIELVRFLKGGETTFSVTPDWLPTSRIKYCVTLDADTNIGIGALGELVGAMAHPLNRPVIDEKSGTVTEGYGIMQPLTSPELSSAGKTPFSRLMCGEGGVDIYSEARFDLYQTLFGEGIFCGKGIFDIDAFSKVIDRLNPFPEDYILSHDSLEGARLRCAVLSDMIFTDSFPKNELSYLKRSHRWIRGDVQNTVFLEREAKFPDGKRVKNSISPLSKFKLFDNVRRELCPTLSFLALLTAAFVPQRAVFTLVLAALSYYIMPFLLDIASCFLIFDFRSAARRFYSKGVCAGLWQSFLRMLYLIAMLPKTALVTADACLVSLLRMFITKKGLIEWQTAAQGDLGDGSLLSFVWKNLVCAVFGFLVFIFTPSGILRLVSFSWFLFPAVAYLTSKDLHRRSNVKRQAEYKKQMRLYAYDIWRFFAERVNAGENHLPPDNVQLFPAEMTAHRTSPTNIGLYLTSLLAARDFGFIGTDVLCTRLSNTLDTVCSLEKWHGHLYNWYDTGKKSVLSPRFVSTVDSGNLVACLITLASGLRDYVCESTELVSIISTAEKLISETDFSYLYDSERNLFSVGVSEDSGSAFNTCYDLFMSESRITSYIAVASGSVPPKHWSKPARSLITYDGYIGLASWTGTAFEYFMPRLFLPSPPRSLSYEALSFALRCQKERRGTCKSSASKNVSVYGISESGFFAFDSEMNYSYKAFGSPRLGLKRGLAEELVISPYSSFLFLANELSSPLANLKKLRNCGMYGIYGFYEALDFTRSRVKSSPAAVKSYMAHHLGMSLAALCNAYFDDIMCKRFMSDAKMKSACELLEEKIPVGAVIRKPRVPRAAPEKPSRLAYPSSDEAVHGAESLIPSLLSPQTGLISVGNTTLFVSASGHLKFTVHDTLMLDFSSDRYFLTRSLFSFASFGGITLSPTVFPLGDECSRHSFKAGTGHFVFEGKSEAKSAKSDILAAKSLVTVGDGFLRMKLVCTVGEESSSVGGKSGKIRGAFYGIPVISTEKDHFSHTAFSFLFIEASYDAEEKILIFSRRVRREGEKPRFLAAAFSDRKLCFSFDTRAKDIHGTGFSPEDFAQLVTREGCSENIGACVSPAMLLCFDMEESNGSAEAELILSYGETESEAKEKIAFARGRSFDEDMSHASEISVQTALGAGIFPESKSIAKIRNLMAQSVFFGSGVGVGVGKRAFAGESYPKDALWRYGISGDIPVFTLNLSSLSLLSAAKEFLQCYRFLRLGGLSFDLCILCNEGDTYNSPVKTGITEFIFSLSLGDFLGKKNGGVFIVNKSGDEYGGRAIEAFSTYVYEINSEKLSIKRPPVIASPPRLLKKPSLSQDIKPHQPLEMSVKGGFFAKDGSFTVQKDGEFPLPYTHTVAGRSIATLVTHNSLGFTFCGNSSERRITEWKSDPYSDMDGERLLLSSHGAIYDLCAVSRYVTFSCGLAVYRGNVCGYDFEISVYICEKLRAKVCDVTLSCGNVESSNGDTLCFFAEPVMGKNADDKNRCFSKAEGGIATFVGAFSQSLCGMTGFICGKSDAEADFTHSTCITDKAEVFFGVKSAESAAFSAAVKKSISGKKCEGFRFVLGAYRSLSERELILRSLACGYAEKERAVAFAESLIPKISLTVLEKKQAESKAAFGVSVMFNSWLPLQNAVGRFLARCGFYQSGGAYGFRDQLQDCLCLMYSKPDMAKAHIIRCALHQFTEGDVLHWWHGISVGNSICSGVRTRCSDDYLWLVYVTAEYVKYTGDTGILKTWIRYIEAQKLMPDESEKYVFPTKSKLKENLFQHCKRAVDRSMQKIGPRGLPLIGSCDWSDGLNLVGEKGVGESVWMAMFLSLVIDRFVFLCKLMRFNHTAYESFGRGLFTSVERNAVDSGGKYLVRGFYDDGSVLGGSESDECKIDILPQCFYTLAGGSDKKLAASALREAYSRLYDGEMRLTSLFTPPFRDTVKNPGYIKGYVAGIRENGGQYTHAAIWGAKGMFAAASDARTLDEACAFLSMGEDIYLSINPSLRTGGYFGDKIKEAYLTEPYVLCGDVYTNPSHIGRGGWSMYTGAAGWYYTVMLNDILGITLSNLSGESPTMKIRGGHLPFEDILDGCVLCLSPISGAKYTVFYEKAKADNASKSMSNSEIMLDGKKCGGDIRLSEGKHTVVVKFISRFGK